MNGFDIALSLVILLPQVVVLAVFPLWIYRVLRRSGALAEPQRAAEREVEPKVTTGHEKVVPARFPSWHGRYWTRFVGPMVLAALLYGILGVLFLVYSIDPHLQEHFYDRLIRTAVNPLYVLVFFALVVGAPLLAGRGTVSIGFALFPIGSGFLAYLLGLGGLPLDLSVAWPTMAFATVLGALSGGLLVHFLPSPSFGQSFARGTLIKWMVGGAIAVSAGVTLGWVTAHADTSDGGMTPYHADIAAVSLVLTVALLVGLALGTLTVASVRTKSSQPPL